MAYIFFSEYNKSAGIAVYGVLGVKQYYGYTKAEAEKRYKEEAKRTVFYNEGKSNVKNK